MKRLWISVTNKDGKNIGMILLEGNDILIIEIPDELEVEQIPDYHKTPKNVFLTKEDMSKYVNLERVPDEF